MSKAGRFGIKVEIGGKFNKKKNLSSFCLEFRICS